MSEKLWGDPPHRLIAFIPAFSQGKFLDLVLSHAAMWADKILVAANLDKHKRTAAKHEVDFLGFDKPTIYGDLVIAGWKHIWDLYTPTIADSVVVLNEYEIFDDPALVRKATKANPQQAYPVVSYAFANEEEYFTRVDNWNPGLQYRVFPYRHRSSLNWFKTHWEPNYLHELQLGTVPVSNMASLYLWGEDIPNAVLKPWTGGRFFNVG